VNTKNGAAYPVTIEKLPDRLLKVLNEVGMAQNMAVEAAVKKDTALIMDAIEEDIAILPDEKPKAKEAIKEILESHNDIIHWF
jgi:alpha-galactosidase/6-phospho-beta-glucosidase family protein